MKTFETKHYVRELRFLLEIAIVEESTDFSNAWVWITYLEWEACRRWLMDVNRNENYCNN